MAKQKKFKSKNNYAMWVMFSPYLFLLIAFGLIPIIMAILEVPHESRVNPDGGWDAFLIVLQDFRFLSAVRNVLGFMAIFVPTTILFVIVMALMLDVNPTKWKKWLRMAISRSVGSVGRKPLSIRSRKAMGSTRVVTAAMIRKNKAMMMRPR